MQATMAAIAGYFGGYTSKMQPVGDRETKQLREAGSALVAAAHADPHVPSLLSYVAYVQWQLGDEAGWNWFDNEYWSCC